MKRIVFVLGGLLLLGVGCAEVAEPGVGVEVPPSEPPAMMRSEKESALGEEKKEESGLKLQAEALGGGQVKFTWDAPGGLTEANRFIIVQGIEANPMHDGKHNWFRQYYPNRAVIWGKLSAGPTHFRICLTENNDHDTCVRYSNDVFLEVQ